MSNINLLCSFRVELNRPKIQGIENYETDGIYIYWEWNCIKGVLNIKGDLIRSRRVYYLNMIVAMTQ